MTNELTRDPVDCLRCRDSGVVIKSNKVWADVYWCDCLRGQDGKKREKQTCNCPGNQVPFDCPVHGAVENPNWPLLMSGKRPIGTQ